MIEIGKSNNTYQLHGERDTIYCTNYPVIDSHIHLGGRYRFEQYWEKYDLDSVISELQKNGVNHIVNLELFTKKHWDFALKRTEKYRDFVSLCAPICFDHVNDLSFEKIIRSEINYYHENGACGFKVWKNLGLSLRNEKGKLYTLNDRRFDFIWEEAAFNDMPIVIHVADPPAFWKPINSQNHRYLELINNPKWSYYNLDVRYEELIEQLEKLLSDNPKTTFVVAHMCAVAHDLEFVSKMLKKYDNLYVDTAAVLSEIGRQPQQFYKLANAYSNRIIFGTDYFAGDSIPHELYYRFLETNDKKFPYSPDGKYTQGFWDISGCGLRDEVLRNIYYKNAQRIFNLER